MHAACMQAWSCGEGYSAYCLTEGFAVWVVRLYDNAPTNVRDLVCASRITWPVHQVELKSAFTTDLTGSSVLVLSVK